MNTWFTFIAASAVIIIAGRKLVYYGDSFAKERGWGDVWIGFVLLALATTLPELFTSIGSVVMAKAPDLAIGDVLGSIIFNLFIIFILDTIYRQGGILRKIDRSLIVCCWVSVILCATVATGISIRNQITILGIGLPSILIIFTWLVGVKLVFGLKIEGEESGKHNKKVSRALLKYLGCAGLIFLASIWLVKSAKEIAVETGWGETFVGTLFLAIATSLPEVTTTISALRRKAFNMAIGNILGANVFDVVLVSICDAVMPGRNIFSEVSPAHTLTALFGILMTAVVMVGIAHRTQKSFLKLGWDSIAIAVIYLLGSYILFSLG